MQYSHLIELDNFSVSPSSSGTCNSMIWGIVQASATSPVTVKTIIQAVIQQQANVCQIRSNPQGIDYKALL